MKKSAFVLVETIAVISAFVLVSLLIGELLISSYKMTDRAKKRYALEEKKRNFIVSLYAQNSDTAAAVHCAMNYSQKITVTDIGSGQKAAEKFDVIWKK